MDARVQCGRAASRAATIRRASGSRPTVRTRASAARLARDPFAADDPGEQFEGLVLGEDVEFHAVRAGQRGEAGAAGDEDGAAAAAGEQRQDLALAGGVVEDDEDPAGGEPGAVHLGPLVEGFGDELAGDAEGAQEPSEDFLGVAGCRSSRAGRSRAGRRGIRSRRACGRRGRRGWICRCRAFR
ncbi:hypothetical protein O1L60_01280 [Streptomyces diastatochromogenes]|nr:hypothetical protein [Streptomyces diastatochromogenes]